MRSQIYFLFKQMIHEFRTFFFTDHYPLHSNVPDTTWGNRRHLLATTPTQNTNNSYYVVYYSNCTSQNISGSRSEAHGPVWEQCDTEKSTNLSGLFIFIYIFCTIVTFIGEFDWWSVTYLRVFALYSCMLIVYSKSFLFF